MLEFADIYDEYFSRIYNYVRYRVGDAAQTDETVSGVFEKALARLPSFDADKGGIDAWLFAIARNMVNDGFREQKPWAPLDRADHIAAPEPKLDHELERKESHRELLAAMERLNERQKELLALKFGARMTNRDIAAQLNLSESNVAVMIYRAIKQLQSVMSEKS